MKRLLILALLLLLVVLSANASEKARAGHVIIISFDQAAPRVIQKSAMPVYKEMAAQGAHTWEAYTIVPSLTLPSHSSMLTGVGIQKHQVSWNDYQPNKGTVSVPTIFSLAKEQGLRTAMVVGKEKFRHLLQPGSVDTFLVAGDCGAVAEAFVKDVVKLSPQLCFLHFTDPDTTGHQFGVESPEQLAALARCDQALQKVRQAVLASEMGSSSVFLLTSDHGGHNTLNNEGKNVGVHGSSEPEDVQIPWIAWGSGVRKGAQLTQAIVIYDTAATALWLLGIPVPESFWGRPVTGAFAAP